MGYTLSFDASVKCTMNDVGGLAHHVARDVDQVNGCEVQHSNKDIDQARTRLNTTLVADGKGGWMGCTDAHQITDALTERLSHVKKPLRKDAVVLRGLILQLDPDWYEEHTDTGERVDAEQHMMDWAVDTFGAENLIYVALHEDEGSRHLHVGFCPVTADGRLAQKDWFPSPADLRKKHDQFRQHMRDAGYDIMKERKKPGKYAKRMEPDEYKDFARLQEERRDVEQKKRDVEQKEAQLAADQEQLHTDRLNARAEGQRIRQQAQNAGAVYIANAQATAAAAEVEAEEYRARRHSEADQEADEIRRQAQADAEAIREAAKAEAEREAQAIREAAQRDAEAKQKDWEEKRDQMKAEFKQQLETQLQEKRAEYNALQNAYTATQEAARRDVMAWDAQEARQGLKSLLAASGAAVEYAVTMTAIDLRAVDKAIKATPIDEGSHVGPVMARLMQMNALTDARNAAPGPTTVEGPTM